MEQPVLEVEYTISKSDGDHSDPVITSFSFSNPQIQSTYNVDDEPYETKDREKVKP